MTNRYAVSETKLTQKQVEGVAEMYKISPWNKTGEDRYYLNLKQLNEIIGLTVEFHNSGTVSDCYYTGADGQKEDVANRRAWSTAGYGFSNKAFIEGDTVYCDWTPYGANIAELIAFRINENF